MFPLSCPAASAVVEWHGPAQWEMFAWIKFQEVQRWHMSSTHHSITETDILAAVIVPDQGDLSPEAARSLLELKFGPQAERQMTELAERNQRGELTPAEQADLVKYSRVGAFLNLIQAKARLSLASESESPR